MQKLPLHPDESIPVIRNAPMFTELRAMIPVISRLNVMGRAYRKHISNAY